MRRAPLLAGGRWLRTGKAAALCLGAALHAQAAPSDCPAFATDLRAMVLADQALRSRWPMDELASAKTAPRIVELTLVVDRRNTERLKVHVARCGWPTLGAYGDEAVNDAWLLAQHADHDPAFQKRVLVLLEAAVRDGQAPGGQLAYRADRVAIAEGRPQLYGTQLDVKGGCEVEFMAMDDVEKVEARRRTIGWPSLEVYKRRVIEELLPPHCRSQP